MITFATILNNIKLIAVIALVVAAVWFYKDYEHQKSENVRQSENASQLRKADSLKFAKQILSQEEIKEYLLYQNSDLKNKLDASGIKVKQIENIISKAYKYKDTSRKETDLSGLVESIKNSVPKEQTWIDTTKCMVITGKVVYDGKKLSNIIESREFKNKSDDVAYWERREWKLLWFKTRFLGKKVITSKSFNECGESQTIVVEKKK